MKFFKCLWIDLNSINVSRWNRLKFQSAANSFLSYEFVDLAADWRVATAKSKKTCLKTTEGNKNKNKLTKQNWNKSQKTKQEGRVKDTMPDSEPAGSSSRPKTAMAESQNQNSNGGSSQSETTNQNSGARAGSSGMPMQGGAGPSNSSATPSKAMVKYGELVILGYNGQLPQGDYLQGPR